MQRRALPTQHETGVSKIQLFRMTIPNALYAKQERQLHMHRLSPKPTDEHN